MKSQLTFNKGLKDGIPIGLGYLSVSFGFGIMVTAQGFPALWAILVSLTNVTSAGQVAGMAVIASCGSLTEMMLTQLLINLRYSLMGISLTQKLDEKFTVPHRLICSFAITDEIFGVASSQKEPVTPRYFYGLALFPIASWILGTTFGAFAGNILPANLTNSLCLAIYGMFLAIIIPPARESKGTLIVILIAAATSCCFEYVPFLSSVGDGFTVIICAVIAAVIGSIFFPTYSEVEKGGESEVQQ